MASAPKKTKREKVEAKSDKNNEEDRKDIRPICERVGCPTESLTCVLEVCQDCINRQAGDKKTHPWMHLSLGEHVCNSCSEFYSKSQAIGYSDYYQWKKVWTANARSDAHIGTFISDQVLPFWAQCMRCNKWREMGRYFDLSKELAESYICVTSCEEPEDEKVQAAKQPQWINTLLYPPYLMQSPAAAYLKGYYPDAVGMSASEAALSESGADNFTKPFHDTNGCLYAMSVRPDVMDFDETVEFPEFACAQTMYLCLRNLVIASWASSPTEWLTLDKCRHRVICRGLVRVRCVQDLERVISFLTFKSVINCGILSQPAPSVFSSKVNKGDVVIIGAGIAGLAAAQHLHRHGIKAQVLEVKERLGGRIHTTRLSSGVLMSLGPDIINGSINNPIALMARQAKLIVQEFPVSNMFVLGKLGRSVSADSLRKAENRYLQVIDLMYEWAHNPDNQDDSDVSIQQKAEELNKRIEEDEEPLTEEETLLVSMHMKLLETTLGCDLSEASARHWNSQDGYPQFGGPSFIIKHGLGALLMKMAAGLGIEYKKQAVKVTRKDRLEVLCADGSVYSCDKLLVTTSLHVLKSKGIVFDPDIDADKRSAIDAVGCGHVEKVVMHFKKKFWAPKVHGTRVFTSLSLLSDPTAPAHIFYDMSSNSGHVLAMYVYDKMYKELTRDATSVEDQEARIGNACMECVKLMFPNAPEPVTTTVSRWSVDDQTGMSRGYLPVGVTPDHYQIISNSKLENKIFFGGEACVPSHPHTVCGAYISGVQQAVRIMECLEPASTSTTATSTATTSTTATSTAPSSTTASTAASGQP